jgi:benzoate-CoA ligase
MTLSQADHSTSPPRVEIPRQYNAAHDLLARNAQRAAKPAFIDASTGAQLTYGELTEQAHRFANALRSRGLAPESRVLVAMLDTPEWPVVFLGCMLAGVVPVAANTLLTAKDFEFMLRDSRAQMLFVSQPLWPAFEAFADTLPDLQSVVRAGTQGPGQRRRPGCRGRFSTPGRTHMRRRRSVLAVFQRLHWRAQGHGAPAQPPDPDGRAVCTPGSGHTRKRRGVFGSQAVFCLRSGQWPDLPDERGRHGRAAALTPHPVRCVRRAEEIQAHHLLRRAHAVCRAAGRRRTPPKRAELSLRVCTSAGEALPAEIGGSGPPNTAARSWTASAPPRCCTSF